MKNLILGFIFALVTFWGNTQTTASQTNTPIFFAQCALNMQDDAQFTELEDQLRTIPYVLTVRVDKISKTLFLLTKDLSVFSGNEFSSWMGQFSDKYSCLNIGLKGIDQIKVNPNEGCDE